MRACDEVKVEVEVEVMSRGSKAQAFSPELQLAGKRLPGSMVRFSIWKLVPDSISGHKL